MYFSRCSLQTCSPGLLWLPESWSGRVRHLCQHHQPHLHQSHFIWKHRRSRLQIHLVTWVKSEETRFATCSILTTIDQAAMKMWTVYSWSLEDHPDKWMDRFDPHSVDFDVDIYRRLFNQAKRTPAPGPPIIRGPNYFLANKLI